MLLHPVGRTQNLGGLEHLGSCIDAWRLRHPEPRLRPCGVGGGSDACSLVTGGAIRAWNLVGTFSKSRTARPRVTQEDSLEEALGYKGCKKGVEG